jgi:PAS domain S-box-containing protein
MSALRPTASGAVPDAEQAAAPPRPSLRAHLVALVLAVLLPALAFGAAAAWEALRSYRAASDARLHDTARALALAVDSEVASHLAALRVLAASRDLDAGGDLAAFDALARATAAAFGSWVVVYERGARPVLNTLVPLGAPLPAGGGVGPGGGGVAAARVFDTGRPAVSDLALGRLSGRQVAFAFAPVVRGGTVQRVVGMALTPERLSQLLARHAASGDEGAVALTDSRGVMVARSRDAEQVLGRRMPSRADGEPQGESGLLAGTSLLDGAPLRIAHHGIGSAPGWGLWVNEPEAFSVAWRRPLLALAAGGALAFALGLALAAWLARRLLRPVSALVRRAEAVAAGAPVTGAALPAVPPARVAEFEALRLATGRAEAALREGEARLRETLATLDLGAFIARDPDDTIRFWSEGCARLYGWTAAEAVGQKAHDLFRTAFPVSRVEVEAALERDGEWTGDVRQRTRDGTEVIVAVRKALRRDATGRPAGVVEAVVDVTAQRRAEEALLASEERLREADRRQAEVLASIGEVIYALDADARFAFASGRALALWDRTAAELLGRPFLEAFPQAAGTAAWQVQERALRQGEEAHFCTLSPVVGRWIEVDVYPREGGGITTAFRDIDDRRRSERERRAAEAALRAEAEQRRLALAAARMGVWSWREDRDEMSWDERAADIIGWQPGRPVARGEFRRVVDPAHHASLDEAVAEAARETESYEAEVRIRRPSDGTPRWVLSRARREMLPGGGRLWRGVVLDVTERKEAEERQALLMREVDHRAKNALAVVQAALRLTPKDDPEAYARAVEGRVRALARAHTLLAEGRWEGAGLRAVLDAELAPFLVSAGLPGATGDAPAVRRVDVAGPSLRLASNAAQALAMAIHELATNATKHGALGARSGRVSVSWSVDREAGVLRLRWAECGGPPVQGPPARRGFGSKVVEATVRGQLGGTVERRWEPAGLVVEVAVPLARIEAGEVAAREAAAIPS